MCAWMEDMVTAAQVSWAVSGAWALREELRGDEGFPRLDRGWVLGPPQLPPCKALLVAALAVGDQCGWRVPPAGAAVQMLIPRGCGLWFLLLG